MLVIHTHTCIRTHRHTCTTCISHTHTHTPTHQTHVHTSTHQTHVHTSHTHTHQHTKHMYMYAHDTHTPAECSAATTLLQQPSLPDGILFHLKQHQNIIAEDRPTTYPALTLVALVTEEKKVLTNLVSINGES